MHRDLTPPPQHIPAFGRLNECNSANIGVGRTQEGFKASALYGRGSSDEQILKQGLPQSKSGQGSSDD